MIQADIFSSLACYLLIASFRFYDKNEYEIWLPASSENT